MESTMSETIELNSTTSWPFGQRVEINGTAVAALERCAIRWYAAADGCKPVLYLDGKRVAKKWRLYVAVECEGEADGGASNANTA
jgi:hypothetical protein